ncbi:Na(+)/citrate cotransporter-like [Glandiceps talaboti]
MAHTAKVLRLLLAKRNIFIVLLTPLLSLPLPILIPTPAGKCGYVTIIFVVFLLFEAIPLPITGLLPTIAFPLLGIQDYKSVAQNYCNDTMLFVIAVVIIASAVESTNLHKRIVLRILSILGSSPYRLLAGLMCSGFLLSMWIPNIAVVPMMMPIAIGINQELGKQHNVVHKLKSKPPQLTNAPDAEMVDTVDMESRSGEDGFGDGQEAGKYPAGKYMLLGLLYSINLGGSATLIGTVMPLLANGQLEIQYGPGTVVSYGKWLAFAFVVELCCLVCTTIWIMFLMWWVLWKDRKNKMYEQEAEHEVNAANSEIQLVNVGKQSKTNVHAYIKQESLKLGKLTWAEGCTLVLILIITLLWCFTDLDDVDGWFSLFMDGYPSVTCVTSGFAVLFFIIPNDFNQFSLAHEPEKYKAILDWNYVLKKIPWGIFVLVVGGYFALGSGIKTTGALTGLSDVLSESLTDVEVWKLVLIITILAAIMTEFIGNIAILLVFFPICVTLAEVSNSHPHLLVVPMVLACNMALMLPIATAPNLVFYTYNEVTIGDMVKCGWMVNVISLLFVNVLINSYGYVIFDFDTIPEWASSSSESTFAMSNYTTLENTTM